MIKKERSLVSKSSNSLNAMIKRSSVTINNNHLKKIGFIATAIILLSVTATFGFSPNEDVFAKKPQEVIEWSNGFPSGEHANLNIHGKKLDPFYNCDNIVTDEGFGKSIFVPITTTDEFPGPAKIEFVSNKRASGFSILQVLDPCAAPFGQENTPDAALVQLESEEMQVYWRILGKPDNGNSPSTAMLSHPTLIEACNFLPIAFDDGSIVNSFDPDAVAVLTLIEFNGNEKYVDVGPAGFDSGDSIYRDAGTPDEVDGADTHLYGPMVATDENIALVSFDPSVKHEDTTGSMGDEFDDMETVYLDIIPLGVVSTGDTRLANAASQGLEDTEGGDEIDCSQDTLVGLGLVNNQGVFKKTEFGLERFVEDPDPEPVKGKGKGKSKAIEITDLFTWSGVLCDPSLDTDGPAADGELTLADFPGLTDLIILGEVDDATAELLWPIGNHDEPGDHTTNVDFGNGISEEEFTAYLATLDECEEITEQWIFVIADIVRYGLDYVNNGSTLTQMRFYPVDTLLD